MLYLKDNPLLKEPLRGEHTKERLLGHWGSDAGQCFTYVHFNRLVNKYDLNATFLSGPGHGAPAVLSQGYLEGTYSPVYPDKSQDETGMQPNVRKHHCSRPKHIEPGLARWRSSSRATNHHRTACCGAEAEKEHKAIPRHR
jgi:phosphoketolase